jgi:hypothetical protein
MAYLLGWLKGSVVTSYSTTFPATENPISEGGIWLNGATDGLDWTDMKTASGRAYSPAFVTGFHDGLAQLKTSFLACTSNQFSEGVVYVSAPGGGANEIELYDLNADQMEAKNVAEQQPDVVRQIRAFMTAAHVPSPNWSWVRRSTVSSRHRPTRG